MVLNANAWTQARLRREDKVLRETLAEEAVKSLQEALSMTSGSLRQSHQDVWGALWTTGFGISRLVGSWQARLKITLQFHSRC